jgi:hypothetical protein
MASNGLSKCQIQVLLLFRCFLDLLSIVAVSWSRVLRVADEARGIPVPISAGSPDLDAVLGQAPRVPGEPYWAVADDANL